MTCGHITDSSSMRDSFVTPLSPLLFDRLPVWQIIGRDTQIMWNWELVSVDLGGGSGGIDYPSSLTNIGLFFFHLNSGVFWWEEN